MKTSKLTPKGKFTANVRISVTYYISVTYRYGRILTANCCARQLIFYCLRAQWVALREQICAIVPIVSRLAPLEHYSTMGVNYLTFVMDSSEYEV